MNQSDRYNALRSTLRTGDVVLFSGKGGISSIIKYWTRSKWSHVGMVVRSFDLDMLLLIESTTLSNITDIDTGLKRSGVQVVPLSMRLSSYDGDVAVRRVSGDRTDDDHRTVGKLRREYRGVPYEESNLQLIRSDYDGFAGDNERDVSSLFCSELVAEMWQALGWIRADVPSNELTPANFAGEGAEAVDDCWASERSLGPVEAVIT